MIKTIALLAAVVCCASALTFQEWKQTHNKAYETEAEESRRLAIWARNMKFIEEFNKQGASYELGMNEFGDLEHREFASRFLSSAPMDLSRVDGELHQVTGYNLPSSVDWRQKGFVTPVKNQGQCGSCWSFSTTGSVEGQHFNATGKLVSLSEQNLVDCSRAEGNQGCQGGLMVDAFKYIIKNGGIDTESSYPYRGVNGQCHFSKDNIGATISSYRQVKKDSELDLQDAVAVVGPISVAIDASDISFQFYKKGVYDPKFCSSTNLDHGVLAVGYGTEDSKDYWLVKNSWGSSWGSDGYINMVRNNNNKCGIASSASYPLV